VQTQIYGLLAGRVGSHLQDGDTIGVWTFAAGVHMGDMPLQQWTARNSSIIADNLTAFVGTQDYEKSTDFKELQPYLNSLVAHSGRLIVLIFSDGDGEIVGTPYDKNISKNFQTDRSALKKAKQPFVLVLASQQGRYVGANLGEPPGAVSIPNFPAWPVPPAPTNVPPPAPPVVIQPTPPPPVVPSLILIGHPNPQPAPAPTAVTNAPPVVVPLPVVNPAPVTTPVPPVLSPAPEPATASNPVVPPPPAPTEIATVSPPTGAMATNPVEQVKNTVPATMTATNPAISTKTNAVPAPREPADSNTKLLIGIGVGLLIAAGILAVALLTRSRRNHSSLISDSMREK
jgi:hypothetical protein